MCIRDRRRVHGAWPGYLCDNSAFAAFEVRVPGSAEPLRRETVALNSKISLEPPKGVQEFELILVGAPNGIEEATVSVEVKLKPEDSFVIANDTAGGSVFPQVARFDETEDFRPEGKHFHCGAHRYALNGRTVTVLLLSRIRQAPCSIFFRRIPSLRVSLRLEAANETDVATLSKKFIQGSLAINLKVEKWQLKVTAIRKGSVIIDMMVHSRASTLVPGVTNAEVQAELKGYETRMREVIQRRELAMEVKVLDVEIYGGTNIAFVWPAIEAKDSDEEKTIEKEIAKDKLLQTEIRWSLILIIVTISIACLALIAFIVYRMLKYRESIKWVEEKEKKLKAAEAKTRNSFVEMKEL
eukprot:TRINITY_DN7454_c0_g3_i1.p1 TRINITY_DN7454_c0_g3~~TRINITY_DN7454_c0_g3_i1.p1  ORF type:complete len:369 (+),score=82.98 TRINITY_DN7454_c0_g3_i1:47-1108(+)